MKMLNVYSSNTFGWHEALQGMRNPMNSWYKSDSGWCFDENNSNIHSCPPNSCDVCPNSNKDGSCTADEETFYVIGKNDLELCESLINGGSEHRKFLRMLHIQMTVSAPLYWWKEFDTYKIGTTSNSCSTMHKIHSRPLFLDDFSHEHLSGMSLDLLEKTIDTLNYYRKEYNASHDKKYWWQMIQLLPTSYNQVRTLDFNYETALNIIKQRKGHKLDEWHELIKELEKLPYMKEFSSVGNPFLDMSEDND